MMMKSRSKFKYKKLAVSLLLVAVVFQYRYQISQFVAPITDSVSYTIDRITLSKTKLMSDRHNLQRQISDLIVENQRLKNSLRIADVGTSTGLSLELVGDAVITSIPPFGARLGLINYGLETDNTLNDNQRQFVTADNFLLGIRIDNDSFRPFTNNDKLEILMNDGSTVEITEIPRPFIYQLQLPKDEVEPDGLLEVNSHKVLGFLVDRTSLNPTTDLVTYRLPIMPQLYQRVELLKN